MDRFEFNANLKRITFILMGIGLIALVLGIVGAMGGADEHGHNHAAQRLWSNILISGFFFFGISIIGTFFLAVQYAAEAGWTVIFKRVLEAVSAYVPIGGFVLIIVFAAGSLHFHHLYHWMDPELYDPNSPHYDKIIAGKQAYLNQPFFWARTLIYLGVWTWFTMRFRKRSLQEDEVGGTDIHYKNVRDAAIFLVFFGFTSSTAAWDWIMSIDTHWFSTLFGWYVFSGMWISGMVVITILTLYLRDKGLLPQINDSHIHDLGKWVFAVSFLWTYLFFSQFMLIWYSNIPEEVTYFQARIDHYKPVFWGMMIVNFILPMLLLMDRDNKRSKWLLIVVGIVILCSHWVDVYLLITPGTMKADWHFGFLEIGLALGFLGLFLNRVFTALAQAPLTAKNHPFLEESIHHEIH